MKHVFTLTSPPERIPSRAFLDGAYDLLRRGKRIPLTERITEIETNPGERISLLPRESKE
jgi:hypothetical protein